MEDVDCHNNKIHYSPHHAVVKESSETTKLLVVIDASAKTKAEHNSLNDCLHKGPCLTPDLCGMLLRFRLKPIALMADVENAFLQVNLAMADRDVTRFLWLRDVTAPIYTGNVVVYRFCRVSFGVISSPFLLSATLDHHLAKENSDVKEQLRANMYVDNMLAGTSNSEEASEFYKEAKSTFNSASMNRRSWTSNCREFLNSIPELDQSDLEVQYLGLQWNVYPTRSTSARSL